MSPVELGATLSSGRAPPAGKRFVEPSLVRVVFHTVAPIYQIDATLIFIHDKPLADQFRQRAVIGDEVLRAAGEVGELRGGDVDS